MNRRTIPQVEYETSARGRHLSAWLASAVVLCVVCGCRSFGLTTGQESRGPDWMKVTALTADGQLDMKRIPGWPGVRAFAVGQVSVYKARGPFDNRILWRCEKLKIRSGREVEALVCVIDDSDDGSVLHGGDQVNDCYVVDYGCDGVVDRMVDWIDNDGDGVPDEMDIRYFDKGTLSHCWFGVDYDRDGKMWSLTGYEYGGPSFFEADPYGDNMIYMNKFDPTRGTWAPISECPFAFYDTDDDGFSEEVVRVSAVPLDYDRSDHPDYANNQYGAPWSAEMERMGVVNIRYSFDIDNLNDAERPLHYDFGFNLVGATPYEFLGMHHYNPRRRPPQTTVVTPYHRLRGIADRFAASETGLSWHENVDDTIEIGYGRHADEDRRWEGVFWIWERRFMENTGGPNQKWNVRREWRSEPSSRRELYLSRVDNRLHLVGAEEGWLQVGHFAGLGRIGEVRTFDTDGNGFFDRWELYLGDDPLPVRVTTVRDERVTRLGLFNFERTRKLHAEQVLPQAMADNERLMAAMEGIRPFAIDEKLQRAMREGSPDFRRYAQDIARELQYQDLRKYFQSLAQNVLDGCKMNDLAAKPLRHRKWTPNSYTAWRVLRVLQRLDVAVGQGETDEAVALLEELRRSMTPLETPIAPETKN